MAEKKIKERYLLVLQDPKGNYFLSGRYFQINEKLSDNIEKKYKGCVLIKIAEWSKEVFVNMIDTPKQSTTA